MSDFAAEFANYCTAHGQPEHIEVMLCDINAVLRGKWLPGDQAAKLETGDVRLPLSTYAPNIMGAEVEATGLGITVGDPDGFMAPIPGTLKPVPWAPGTAQVLVELQDDNGEIPLSSRAVLQRVLKRFTDKGLHPVVATELEFYIVQKRDTPDEAPTPPEHLPDAQNYDLEVLSRHSNVLTDIQAASRAQGLAIDTLIAEYGPGQFEINFHHTDDVLDAADTALMFRRIVREVVANHGMEATFMAKPYADFPGNGMHAHVSVLDANGVNIFAADSGLSDTLGNAVAGTLTSMRDLQAIFAPHMNSYRRFLPLSFAPSAPNWGMDNRSAGIRIPESSGKGARLEHRISGADVNPYLALAAILGGILYGLETKPDLPPSLESDPAPDIAPLTSDWNASVARFAASDIAADLFGPAFRDLYAILRRDEIATLTTVISPIEYRTYLSRL